MINALSKLKVCNYLMSIQHHAEMFGENHENIDEVKLLNAGKMDAIDDLFSEIDSGRLDL